MGSTRPNEPNLTGSARSTTNLGMGGVYVAALWLLTNSYPNRVSVASPLLLLYPDINIVSISIVTRFTKLTYHKFTAIIVIVMCRIFVFTAAHM
jgi:hypothetical protein